MFAFNKIFFILTIRISQRNCIKKRKHLSLIFDNIYYSIKFILGINIKCECLILNCEKTNQIEDVDGNEDVKWCEGSKTYF